MVAAAVAAGPRYAPPDATLPTPWRALVDGSTGYIYYWNPETNVTQYEKPQPPPTSVPPPLPAGPPPASVATGPKLAAIPTGPSAISNDVHHGAPVNGHASSSGVNKSSNGAFHTGGGGGGSVGMSAQPKLAAIPVPRGQQGSGGMPMPSHLTGSNANGPGPVAVTSSAAITGGYKRGADGGDYNDQDGYKRPRTQVYPEVASQADVEAYRRQHEVSALGENVPAPFMTFEAAQFPPDLLRELRSAGFTSPTPIQAQTWPIALQNRDIVAIAKTGSGKTLGYLVPAFLHLERNRSNSRLGPTVLVLAPTRELATQIQDEAVKFGRSSRLTSTCVYGGAPKGPQLRDIERGADIVIATPGRLNDFLEVKKVSLRQVTYLVLDEADRMLDMGFEPQIRKIVNEIPPRRQTLMYTATWPKEVRKIAGDLLVSPVQVNIGSTDELSANKSITQHVEVVPPFEKQRRLEQILRGQEPGSKIIVFCSTKRMCDQLARSLGRDFGASAIHGDKSQGERDWVLNQFRNGKSPVLVATDVAARGLDIKDIRVVINYDFPTGVEDYVHRIGRTGRAGASGIAHTFFSEQDGKYAKELIKVLEGANQKVPQELRDIAGRGGYIKGRGIGGRWDTGGRGGRDGGGRGYGGRGEGYGGRGSWSGGGRDMGRDGGGRFDNRDRHFDRFGDRDRFADRDVGRDRYGDDWDRNRAEGGRRYGEKERGRSYSRSFSRSPSPRGRARSYSRSRSRSYDRSYDDRVKDRSRSPYRALSPYRGALSPGAKRSSPPRANRGSPYRGDKSPAANRGSPYRGDKSPVGIRGSPYRHDRSPAANRGSPYRGEKGSAANRGSPYRGEKGPAPNRGSPYRGDKGPSASANRGSPYRSPYGSPYRSPYRGEKGPAANRSSPYRGDKGPATNRGSPYRSDKGPAANRGSPYRGDKCPSANMGSPYRGDKGLAANRVSPYRGDKGPPAFEANMPDSPYRTDQGGLLPKADKVSGGSPLKDDRDASPFRGDLGLSPYTADRVESPYKDERSKR